MIGVIGCGNMAQAIVMGYFKKNKSVPFLTYTPSFTRAEELAKAVNGKAAKNLTEFQTVNTLVIACKPQQLDDLAIKLKAARVDLSNKHIISILAATPINSLKQKLGSSKISRVMPNTPCLIGKGMSLVLHSEEVAQEQKDLVEDFFTSCGEIAEIPTELLFDQVTTVSGSGPAYVFLFAEAMADKLARWGLDPKQSKKIAIQLFCGSSELMQDQNKDSLSDLISKVTSKGGVTIEAVKSFQENRLSEITASALEAAFERSEQIQKDLS